MEKSEEGSTRNRALGNSALRLAREFVLSQNGILASLAMSEEELRPEVQDDGSLSTYPLESMDEINSVERLDEGAARSEFRFFEDGRQRTIQIGHIPVDIGDIRVIVPVHFFVAAAVILERQDRKLKLWGAPIIRQGIVIEKSLVPDQSEKYAEAGLEVLDSHAVGGDYYDLKKHALNMVKGMRLEAEQELITLWRKSPSSKDEFLVVDGTLMNLRDEENIQRCIGVSKSFGTRFCSASDHTRILGMKEFERSWVFRFHDPTAGPEDLKMGRRERISWYLRLRARPNVDPEFGLIRVELAKEYADDATIYADRFSQSLLVERLPVSHPAPRWHNHLYPVFVCERYLSSILPSVKTIAASMRG